MVRPLVVVLVLVASAARGDEAQERRLADAARLASVTVSLGRWMARTRFDELLDEALYGIVPRGVWNERHPAWPSARAALATLVRRETAARLDAGFRARALRIDPTVVVMRFDLGALVKLGAPANGQEIGTPRLNEGVEYGTRVPATGTLLWFSPEADQSPTKVPLVAPAARSWCGTSGSG